MVLDEVGFFKDKIKEYSTRLQPISTNPFDPNDREIQKEILDQAEEKFSQKIPIFSAAIHLSINDSKRAIKKLILSSRIEYAYVVASLCNLKLIDQVITLLIPKVQAVHVVALKLISQVSDPTLKQLLQASAQIGEI